MAMCRYCRYLWQFYILIVPTNLERSRQIAEITPTSVAQGKTKEADAGDDTCCAASFAIDGDLSTRAVTHTEDGAGWLKLHFDENHFIHKIVIYQRFYTNWYISDNWCTLSESNFKKCMPNHTIDVSLYKENVHQKSCGTLQRSEGLAQSDQIYNFICNADGNMVKLSQDADVLAIFELVVISTGTADKSSINYQIIQILRANEKLAIHSLLYNQALKTKFAI